MKLTFAKRLLILLVAFNIFLIGAHILLHFLELNVALSDFYQKLVPRFSMDNEVSVPTWFASSLLLVLSFLFGFIAYEKRQKKKPYQNHWMLLGAIFLYLSIDEASELHELAIEPFQNIFDIQSGPLFFAWIIPAIAVLAVLAIIFAKFFFQLPEQARRFYLYAFVLFVLGAVGVEMISGAYWQANDFSNDMTYRLLNAFEEGLENSGLILAIYSTVKFKKKL